MVRRMTLMVILGVCAVLAAPTGTQAETPYSVAWTQQLGTTDNDYSESVTIDGAGNVYISGSTGGIMGVTNAGYEDAFLTKYDPTGAMLWTQQLGTSSSDYSNSVAVDSAGNAFISGYTTGNLGGDNAGSYDAYLAKYDPGGRLLWTQQLGTSNWDLSYSTAVDSAGNAYISGYTKGNLGGANAGGQDAFLAKYNPAGNLQWMRQLGTVGGDQSRSIAIDGADNAYISGFTSASLDGLNAGGYDAFLIKYDPAGNLQWTRQLGTSSHDFSYSVAVDGTDSVFISGFTDGALVGTSAGGRDAFLVKYDAAGNLQWTRQLGTWSSDSSYSVAIDSDGNALISGHTWDSLGGANAGGQDTFLAKYSPAGDLLWARQLGTTTNDYTYAVAIDSAGNAFISGYTLGSLGGPNAGGSVAFLAKYEVPEPATLGLLSLCGLVLLRRRSK